MMSTIASPMRWMIERARADPAVMLGDSHYGSSDNMALTREQNINLVAPARHAERRLLGTADVGGAHSPR